MMRQSLFSKVKAAVDRFRRSAPFLTPPPPKIEPEKPKEHYTANFVRRGSPLALNRRGDQWVHRSKHERRVRRFRKLQRRNS